MDGIDKKYHQVVAQLEYKLHVNAILTYDNAMEIHVVCDSLASITFESV